MKFFAWQTWWDTYCKNEANFTRQEPSISQGGCERERERYWQTERQKQPDRVRERDKKGDTWIFFTPFFRKLGLGYEEGEAVQGWEFIKEKKTVWRKKSTHE